MAQPDSSTQGFLLWRKPLVVNMKDFLQYSETVHFCLDSTLGPVLSTDMECQKKRYRAGGY
jgi:hypothetical protein